MGPHRGVAPAPDAVARLGRVGGGGALALIGLPGLMLVPLFALGAQLPAEAGLDDVASRVMVLLLIWLGLAALVNAVCALVPPAPRRRPPRA